MASATLYSSEYYLYSKAYGWSIPHNLYFPHINHPDQGVACIKYTLPAGTINITGAYLAGQYNDSIMYWGNGTTTVYIFGKTEKTAQLYTTAIPGGVRSTGNSMTDQVWTNKTFNITSFLSGIQSGTIWLHVLTDSASGYTDAGLMFEAPVLTIDYVSVTACTAPTSVSVNQNNVKPSTSVTLSWSGAASGSGNPITGYDIYRSTSVGSGYSLLTSVATAASSGSTTVTSNATKGASYYYKVVTKGSAGSGLYSGQSSATATLITIPYTNTLKYYNGSTFVECELYTFNNSIFAQCAPYYRQGSSWIECGS